MPHVAFVPLTGLRVQAEEILELGMTLPGLRERAEALAALPALGLLTLAGMTPHPWTCSYHQAARPSDETVQEIVRLRPTLAALSALTASIDEAYLLSSALRGQGVPVVLGGLHATACPEEAIRHCDAVVVGEGEPVWSKVLEDAAHGRLEGVYRSSTPWDLGGAPLPRFDLVAARSLPRWTIQTERGCPFACDFCGASRLLGPFREKPVERIRAELAAIQRANGSAPGDVSPRHLWLELADDNTFAGRRDAEELLTALGESRARYFTEADWRIGERPELLRRLAASGCVQVLVGMESVASSYSGMGAKQADSDRVIDAVSAIQDAGVAVNGCFILGADGETDESIERLGRFIVESPLAEVQITLQTPFPGTALHRRLQQSGRLLENAGWRHYTLFDVTYRPTPLSVEQLRAGFARIVGEVFSAAVSAARAAKRREIWRRNPAFGSRT